MGSIISLRKCPTISPDYLLREVLDYLLFKGAFDY